MSDIDIRAQRTNSSSLRRTSAATDAATIAGLTAFGILSSALPAPAFAASLSRSVTVQGTPSSVWALIGPFCAIRDWLPPVGSCSEDGAMPPTRTLVTRDGSATFIERQTARNDRRHSYSYTFLSSPLPVSRYVSTLSVSARDHGHSKVTWRSEYTPSPGKDAAAKDALTGIYNAGLNSIRTQAAQRVTTVASRGTAR